MKKTLVFALLLALALSCVPARAQEDAQEPATVSVPLLTAYQRAEQPGMYVKLGLRADAAKRIANRLQKYADGAEGDFVNDGKAAGEKLINAWFNATRTNAKDLFEPSEGTGEDYDARIHDGYVAAYDFVRVRDAQGRELLYPVREYGVDLYAELLADMSVSATAKLASRLDEAFESVASAVTDVALKSALENAYAALSPDFALGVDDLRSILPLTATIGEGMTLNDAINASGDMLVGGLGGAQALPVASGEAANAASYRLTLADGALVGAKLETPVTLAEAEAQRGEIALWLNDAGELVYLSAGNSWLSADAAALTEALGERGGAATEAEEAEKPAGGSVNVPVIALAALAAVEAIAIALLVLRSRARRTRRTRREASAEEQA